MPHTRRLQRIAPTGKISVRLTTEQRDMFIHSPHTPMDLGHALHRAPVRNGKLSLRLSRDELDALITAAANASPADRTAERKLLTLLGYLERLEDRFADPVQEEEEVEAERTN